MASNSDEPKESVWKNRPDDDLKWVKAGEGQPYPPSYPFWLSQKNDPSDAKKNVRDTSKKNNDPKKLYHFLHVENQRIQLQQTTWELLMDIMKQDKKMREADADKKKAEDQLKASQGEMEADKGIVEWAEEQLKECKPGEKKRGKMEEDLRSCQKKFDEAIETVKECEQELNKEEDKLKGEKDKLTEMEDKFIHHMKADVPNVPNDNIRGKEKRENPFFCKFSDGEKDGEKCWQSWKYAYAYGAVGDLPMHTCFLLGLVDLGKRVIDELFMYEGLDLISLPYIDDTEAWEIVGDEGAEVISKENKKNYYDGGLFTGETVLHIAIVQNSSHEGLVPWLLKRNCNVVARARGAFFKPKTFFLPSEKNLSGRKEDWFFKRLNRLLGKPGQDDEGRMIENLDSACDYGELPLSFAASVGRLDVCKELLSHVTAGLIGDEVEKIDEKEAQKLLHHDEPDEQLADRVHDKIDQDTERKFQLFENKAWKDFEAKTKEQLEAQKIAISYEERKKERKQEILKIRKEMPVGIVPEEDGIAHKMQKIYKDVKDTRTRDVKFFFLNASVDNYYKQGDKKIYNGGNTALHMAVYHRQTEVIKWLMEEGAMPSLRFMNEHHLTPFTLAAKQGHFEIYDLLTEWMRQTSWVYGQVQMSLLSLEQLDSFRIEGFHLHEQPNWQSAIEVIAYNEVDAFVNEKIFNKLIKEKWEKFGRFMYIKRTLLPYIVLLAIFSAYMFVRCYQINQEWVATIAQGRVFEESRVDTFLMRFQLGDPRPEDVYALASFILHTVLVFGSFWLFMKGLRQKNLEAFWRWRKGIGELDIESLLFKNLVFILDLSSSFLLIVSFLFRVLGMPEAELDVMSILSILMWSNLLNLIMPFKFFGIMAITTYKMLVGDVLRFLLVFVVTTMAFSLAMTVLYQRSLDPDNVEGMDIPGNSVLNLIWASLGQVDNYENISRTRNFSLTITVHIAYCILQTILMLNLLIAMMSRTFNASMDDTHKTWIFPFAQTVLRYEKLLHPKEATKARNRCGEASQGDVAAMTDAEIKRAHFFIVDVGEDQVKKEAQEAASKQEKEHALIIDSVKEKLEKWDGEVTKEGQGADNEEDMGSQDSSKLKDDIERKLKQLQKIIENLSNEEDQGQTGPGNDAKGGEEGEVRPEDGNNGQVEADAQAQDSTHGGDRNQHGNVAETPPRDFRANGGKPPSNHKLVPLPPIKQSSSISREDVRPARRGNRALKLDGGEGPGES